MRVARAVLGSIGFSSSGRRSFHFGSSLMLFSSSSYLARPCSERKRESSISLSCGMSSLFDSSFMLCHDPSFSIVKKFSSLIATQLTVMMRESYFSSEELVVGS